MLVSWLITALWTVAGAGLVDIASTSNQRTGSGSLTWTLVWIMVIGIPSWLIWGYRSSHDDWEGAAIMGAIAYVVVNTILFLVLMLLLLLALSDYVPTN